MCFICCGLLVGVLYAFLIHAVNEKWKTVTARYIWLEVVLGVGATIAVLFFTIGETIHIWQILMAFGLTGAPMAAGSLVRQGFADLLREKREEETL